ncbi:MAG: hypothetical protein QG620_937 [Patescibacteria group bacterium]|nr:hypothetical protein [Patescibacteria group bacterium]
MKPVNINVNSGTPSQSGSFEIKRGASFQSGPRRVEDTSGQVRDSKFVIKAMEKIIGFSIFMLFFGVPLFFTGLTFQGLAFEKQLYFYFFLLLGLIMWAAKGVVSGELNIRRTPLDIPILGFWVIYAVSTFFSIDRWHSFWGSFGDPSRGFMSITAFVVAYYLILSNFSEKRLKMIFAAIISSGAVVLVWTALAIFDVKFLPDSLAVFSPLSLSGTVTGLGVISSALVPLFCVAILKISENETANKVGRNILQGALLLFLALDLFLILAIYNFVPWLALFSGVVVFLVFILAKIVRPNASWVWLPMVVFVAVMAVRMIGSVSIAKVNLPLEVSLNYKTSYDIALASLKADFLTGSGPATFGYDFSLNRSKEFNNNAFYGLRFSQGTGAIFEAAPTIGGLGTIFLVILALSFVGVELFLISRQKEKNKLYSLGMFSAAMVFLVSVLGIGAGGTIYILAVILGAVALATALLESETAENYLSLSLKASPKFALALAFVFMVISAGVAFLFVFLGKVYVADVYAGSAVRGKAASLDDSASSMRKAISLYNKEGRYYTQFGQYYMGLANVEAAKGSEGRDIQKIQQYLNFAVAAARQGREMNPQDVSAAEALAQVYENAGLYVGGSLEAASEAYAKSLELEPHNPNFYLKMGQIKIAMAASEKDEAKKKALVGEAKKMFESSVEEKNGFAPGHYQLSLTLDALGERDAAIESGRKAVELSSKNIDYLINLGKLYQAKGGQDNLAAAEKIFKAAVASNDKNISGHFYLGLFYERNGKGQEAKNEYRKSIEVVSGGDSNELKKQLEKMIANVDAGIENTPETLGLIQKQEETGEIMPE